MVDYNNNNTIATPAIDINRIQILERRAYVIQALKDYYRYRSSGASSNTINVRCNLVALFYELQETIRRKYKDCKELSYQEMYDILFPKKGQSNFEDVIKVWHKINFMLGEMNLTKVDTRKEYDTTDVEEENRVQSL